MIGLHGCGGRKVPQSAIGKLETQERDDGVSSSLSLGWSPKAGGDQCSSLIVRQREWILPSPAFLFYSGLQQIHWGLLHQGGQSALLSLWIQMLISSRSILRDTRMMSDQLSGHPVAHSNWHIKLTVTEGHHIMSLWKGLFSLLLCQEMCQFLDRKHSFCF